MKLRTAKEVGERLGVSALTIVRLFDSGALPGIIVRRGSRKRIIRFREEVIERFIVSREQKTKRAEAASHAR